MKLSLKYYCFLLLLLSCKSSISNLSKSIENKILLEYGSKGKSIFKFREKNVLLREKLLKMHLKEIEFSKNDFYYIIEYCDIDWGGTYFSHVSIDDKIYQYKKDNYFISLEKKNIEYSQDIKTICKELNNGNNHVLIDNSKNFEKMNNCYQSWYIFKINKKNDIIEELKLDCVDFQKY